MTIPIYLPLSEHLDSDNWPFAGFLVDAVKSIYLTPPVFDATTGDTLVGLAPPGNFSIQIPGLDFLRIGISGELGGLVDIRIQPTPTTVTLSALLDLRIRTDVLRPLKAGSNEPDNSAEWLIVPVGRADLSLSREGHVDFNIGAGVRVPRCMIGSSGVILEIGSLRWLTPQTDLSSVPTIATHLPSDFTGLYLENVSIEITSLPIETGRLILKYAFIGTGGFTGEIDWSAAPNLNWTGTDFEHGLHGELFGFKGGLSKVKIAFKQNAFVECDVEGNLFVPYLDRVIGLSLGFDGNGGVTAIAQMPTCQFSNANAAATQGPAGYIITANTSAFTLDISRIEFHAGGSTPATLALSGRAKLKIAAFDLPGVIFKGLRIDSQGQVAVDGGWLDVDKAKSAGLNGFPFQITKIGFGAETPTKRWIGLNGGIKLADGLPVGASVEGLRVSWDLNPPAGQSGVSFSLEGIGLELRVPGTFSFAGKVAFFENDEASGFRGTLKLKLETVKLTIDAGLMIGRTKDGVTFFFFYLDVGLPAGIPLFTTGAAIYGFAGLLATNLKPARSDGENWYYGYYKRPPVGVTDPAKWSVQRDAFAIGLGTTLGSLPDTGFAFSAKVLLILVLPGPQLLLQGKGQFISKKPDEKNPSAEGNFEALLVLDVPAKLFQANLAVAFKIADVIEVSGGVDVAFSWSQSPPADIWHVYLGEKTPAERRIHAKLFKLLNGDSWLMINRTHSWPPGLPDRTGDFEIGGSVGVNFNFDFVVVKAWLDASIMGQAAITWEPRQFTAQMTLKGVAGVSALGLSIVANLLADAQVKAANPWHIDILVEVGVKIDLLLYKWEFHARLPLEFGDANQPLPEPAVNFVTIHADHAKVDEARLLAPAGSGAAVIAPDAKPLIVFDRPVQDRARFGSPGRDDIEPENLGIRQFSYQLRHVVMISTGPGLPRLVAAAGELTISGTTATFTGLTDVANRLPDLAGAEITLFTPGQSVGPLTISSGTGNTATISGGPPPGEYSYRLSGVRIRANVQITSIANAAFSDVVVTIAGTLVNPTGYRGGQLVVGSASWLILEATAGAVRIRVDSSVPYSGAATLVGPEPPSLEGKWFPAGDPVTGPDSSTRLQIGARTPYSFFRHNDQTAIAGLDAFRPDYACGPKAIEEPICTTFKDVVVGALIGPFNTVGLDAEAVGIITAVDVGTGPAKRLEIGDFSTGQGTGTVIFTFDPPADAVWVTADAQEAGWITATREGSIIAKKVIDRKATRQEFNGGIDQIEIIGVLTRIHELCFTPGWTCVNFEEASFRNGQTGSIEYAGLELMSEGLMSVDAGTLEVEPATTTLPMIGTVISGTKIRSASTLRAGMSMSLSSNLAQPNASSAISDGFIEPSITLAVPGLVEPTVVSIPGLGIVKLIQGFREISGPGTLTSVGFTPFPDRISAVEPRRDRYNLPLQDIVIDSGRVWVHGSKTKLASITIKFPRPITRVRVSLASGAEVIGFAGQREVQRAMGTVGSKVSLYANYSTGAHLGWMDRIVIMGPSQVRINGVCTDAGDFGWKRFEQWKWSQGVQRSVESLYSIDPVLAPGDYEFQVHTGTVVTGASPKEVQECVRATFTVGNPPGFPVNSDLGVVPGIYPAGGPLTDLATYVAGTMPAAGAKLWYRSYDTAVHFNEAYVTRMYLESNNELRVFVVNASQVPIRSNTRHVWSGSDAALDAWTDLYVRTLNGDGRAACATVDVGKIVRPEQVTAGGGEPLEPSSLHASELRCVGPNSKVIHRFEFTTSAFVSFRHHLALFDGRCRRLARDSSAVATAISPQQRADARLIQLVKVNTAIVAARTAQSAVTGTATKEVLDAAKATRTALTQAREEARNLGAADFDAIWGECFGSMPPTALTSENVLLSVIEAAALTTGANVLLLESPEPIAWERITLAGLALGATPQRKVTTSLSPQFGRPDAGFEVNFGGILWRAGVELWVVEGALRARADEPLNVTILPERASVVDLVIRVEAGGSATITATPALPGGPVVCGPSVAAVSVTLAATQGSLIDSVRIDGTGVSIESCSITSPFVSISPSGPIRIADIVLPKVNTPLDHELTLLALESVSTDGYCVRWFDANSPGQTQLYANLSPLKLQPGQRVRLIPARASAPVVDDELVLAGGPGVSPSIDGSVFQLIDPLGRVVHECAAMPVLPGAPTSLVAFPNNDGSRAFLVPPSSAPSITAGFCVIGATLSGEAGPDMDRWSVASRLVVENASLRFVIV